MTNINFAILYFEIHCIEDLSFMSTFAANIPPVSVIIPFLNEEHFLSESIESVLKQDYTNWELILIDDGSLEKTSAIAQKYAAAYPTKVFYFDHEGHANKGVCVSRNLGIKKAKGSLIALLDADDVWTPVKLSKQVEIFRQHPHIAMTCEASIYWYCWTASTQNDELIKVREDLEGIYAPAQLSKLLYPLGPGFAPCPSAIMIKKEVCEAVGGFEESFTGIYQLYEDQAFLSKIYLEYPVHLSQECHNYYRCQRKGSPMHSVIGGGKYKEVRKYFLDYFASYLTHKGVQDKELLDLLHKAQLPYGKGLKNFVERAKNKALQYLNR